MAVSNPPALSEQNMTLERLKALYELTRRINSAEDLDELLEFILDRSISLTKGHQGILLLNDDTKYERHHVAVARREHPNQLSIEQTLAFVSSAVVKDILNKGEPHLINDLHTDKQYKYLFGIDTDKFKTIHSVLAIPLKAGELLVGLIYIDHPKIANFGVSDLEFLSAFAGQAAFAIHRTQQHQTQINELTRLNELSRSLVQVLNLDEVLTRIVYEVTSILNVETGSVILLDETGSELTFSTSVSNGQRLDIPTRLKVGEGIAGWVVAQGKPVSINDTNQDTRWFGEVAEGFKTKSLLCVPLQLNGRTLGALQALNKKSPYGFGNGDMALLSAFAASATIAIENARLFQEARQARRLRSLNEAAMALSSILDLEPILNIGLEKTLAVLPAKAGAINLLDDEASPNSFTLRASKGLNNQPTLLPEQIKLLTRVSMIMLREQVNQRIIIDTIHQDYLMTDTALQDAGIKALVIAPIEAGNEIIGTLAVLDDEPYTYSPDETDLLESMGRIIGLAVQNAIHYNQVHTQALQLSYLNEVGGALTRSLDITNVLQVIIEGTEAVLDTDRVSIFLIDQKNKELFLSFGNQDGIQVQIPDFQRNIANWVVKHQQPVLVSNTTPGFEQFQQAMQEANYTDQSVLCVPLKMEKQIIGVVEVLSRPKARNFTHKDQALLIELTRWAAIALHNANLYDERVKAYQRLATEQQRRIAAETRGAMATIVLDMAHTMNNIVGAIRVWATKLEGIAHKGQQIPIDNFTKELTQIRQNTEEAIKLISNMTGPLHVAEVAPTNVHQCLNTAIQSCWWPDNVFLHTNYAKNLPQVKANAQRLETVFHNLLSNATQALTAQGGHVYITTQINPDNWVDIIIGDDGPGIPPELQETMFNPGVSGKDGGLGIGLWLVETFIHHFDGLITFHSEPFFRTNFTVSLQSMET